MANAERRVSYPDDGEEYDSDDYDEDDWEEQICEACGFDLPFGTPKHTPNAKIAFALAVQQAFAVTLSIVSKSLKPNTEHKRPRGESDGDRTIPSTNHG